MSTNVEVISVVNQLELYESYLSFTNAMKTMRMTELEHISAHVSAQLEFGVCYANLSSNQDQREETLLNRCQFLATTIVYVHFIYMSDSPPNNPY